MGRLAGRARFATAMTGLAGVACLLLRSSGVSLAEDVTATPAFRSSRSSAPHSLLEARLQHIAENDQQILAKFDGIMEEMKVVKIRVLRQPQTPPP